jgi:hypothetical protein
VAHWNVEEDWQDLLFEEAGIEAEREEHGRSKSPSLHCFLKSFGQDLPLDVRWRSAHALSSLAILQSELMK